MSVDPGRSPYHPGVPLGHQIQALLRSRIECGEWAAGEQLPTEMALTESFGVSRTTVRAALNELARDGLIERTRGRGTFVSGAVGRMLASADLVTNPVTGREIGIRIVATDRPPAPAHVARFLGVERGEALQRFVRVELADSRPIGVVVNYMPIALGRRIRHEELRRYSMLDYLQSALGIALGDLRVSFESRMPPSEEVASLLEADLTQPLLLMRLLVVDEGGAPVEICETFYRSDRYRFEMNVSGLRPARRGERGQRRYKRYSVAHSRLIASLDEDCPED